MKSTIAFALGGCLGLAGCATGRDPGAGMRIVVTDRLRLKKNTAGQAAEVYLPGWFQVPPGDSITLVLHLHGALRAAEEMLYGAPHDDVLCALQLGVLSSPYRAYFSDTHCLYSVSPRHSLRC